MRVALLSVLAALSAAPALAQAPEPGATIQVVGVGLVQTPPDVATLHYWVSGEGKTADEASAALAAKQKAIVGALSGLLGPHTRITNSDVVIVQVRSRECAGANSYGAQPVLSQGPCAVAGYLASAQGEVRTSAVDKAGTAVGLASRSGAADARLQSFELEDDKAARRAAMAAAVADAQRRAAEIAVAAGRRLGPAISLRDSSYGVPPLPVPPVEGHIPPPPPPPPPPPVRIDLSPRPIETRAQVAASYALAD